MNYFSLTRQSVAELYTNYIHIQTGQHYISWGSDIYIYENDDNILVVSSSCSINCLPKCVFPTVRDIEKPIFIFLFIIDGWHYRSCYIDNWLLEHNWMLWVFVSANWNITAVKGEEKKSVPQMVGVSDGRHENV